MFTLQILDRGQPFLHSLDSAPVVIGADPTAGIRLDEAGVRPQHARLEPHAGGVRLRAIGEVVVNGRAVADVQLALGDRIEIGKAVLVVGRAVTRQARPDEVLADGVPRTRTARAPRGKRKAAWLPFAVAGVVLAGVVAVILRGDDTVLIRNELAAIARLRESGQLEPAAAAIERLRQQWATAADDRLHQLDAEQGRLDAIQVEITRLTAQVVDPSIDRSYAEWTRELRRLEDSGQPAERVAARRVRSVLRETLNQRPAVAVAPREPEAAAPKPPEVATPAAPEPEPPPASVAETQPVPAAPVVVPSAPVVDEAPAVVQGQASGRSADTIRREADRLMQEGRFAQALATLQDALAAAADEAQAAVLRRHLDELRGDVMRHAQILVTRAQQAVRIDKAEEAVALLREAQPRFPTGPEAEMLAKALREAEEETDDGPAPSPVRVASSPSSSGREGTVPSALMELRSQLDAIEHAEQTGAFATAARLLREGADLARERDPAFADRLLGRAEAAELEAAWNEHVAAALAAGRTLKTTTRAGRAMTLRSANDDGLAVTSVDGDGRLAWTDVSPFGLSLLVDLTEPTGRAALGAAVLFYGVGDASRAESLLAKVLPTDASLKTAVDGVLARGRGEPVDQRGYSLGREGFVSARALELQKDVQKLSARLEAALRSRDPAARDAVLTEAMQGGPDVLGVLRTTLQKEFDQQLAKVAASPAKKQYDRLTEQRAVLDAARDAARALIYDEVRYFYPYKPPAVSGEKFAEYNRVQAEVDRLVAALRDVWQDDRVRMRVPAQLGADVERLDWDAKMLMQLGPFDETRLEAVEWARAVPPGETIGVRDHCRTAAERAERAEWRVIEAYNAIAGKQLPSAVREQLKITNEYRAMYGHRPLAIVTPLNTSAQGHAAEMTRLGYFSHTSPTPGRESPYDRMQLAGYRAGSSENIALCDSAQTAHDAWCHSSGHHRNLLNPHHTEVGIGADGRNWVQNFGAGNVHLTDPAWAAAQPQQAR